MIKYGAMLGTYTPEIVKEEFGNGFEPVDTKRCKWFNTWTEAHALLKAEAQTAYDLAKAKYEAAAAELNNVVEMVDPELHDEDTGMCDTENRVCDLCGGCLE